jgi:hypothetical protein
MFFSLFLILVISAMPTKKRKTSSKPTPKRGNAQQCRSHYIHHLEQHFDEIMLIHCVSSLECPLFAISCFYILSCFVEIAPRKTRAKAAEEEKHRTTSKSDLVDRLGSKDASTPSWYDSTPPIKGDIRRVDFCGRQSHPWITSFGWSEKGWRVPRRYGLCHPGFHVR